MIEAPFISLTRRYDIHPTELQIVAGLLGEDVLNRQTAWICGGSVRRALMNEQSSADIDIYTVGESASALVEKRLVEAGFELAKEVNFNRLFVYHGDIKFGRRIAIDVSRRKHSATPQECLKGFDYTICQFALFFDGPDLIVCYPNEALLDATNNLLMPVATGIPDNEQMKRTLRRSRKYMAQGFEVTHTTLAAFCSIAGGLGCQPEA